MKSKQKKAIIECLQSHKDEEYFLGHWLHLINKSLTNNNKFTNTKSLGRALRVLHSKGHIMEKKIVKITGDDGSTYTARYYKYVGEIK